MEKEIKLDQFYTNPIICNSLIEIVQSLIPSQLQNEILEPSAGTGNFIDALVSSGVKPTKILAYDIDPKSHEIIKQDYLNVHIPFSENRFIIGNPPFGHRGKTALEFLNKGLTEANYVAMIFPNIFKRYSIQKKVLPEAKLIFSLNLLEKSFILNDKQYGVKCVFQIWTTKNTYAKNIRIKNKPVIRHEDFQTFIYNNTPQTLKYFEKSIYKWDFAVHRQGYYDYNLKIVDPKDLKTNRQYFFVKILNNEARKIINKINFEKLSKNNTQVYGFSTSDFVEEYMKLKGEK
ncbi:hypothetical protein OF364_02880 [Mycoplasma enhydrae]|uniref:hypothetical protein n=1 Tax=Mycoplasma enhydrae TaxID=2499220 RepID=UPI00197BCD26|nr:hypothetical protein [Mycoplasma enhydrae]MBN4089619.1 hypothetical protein [Mycoplasma enhydrae]MCV3733787.1 hypothetical protein [Mycoplasma enhydrae]MCV3753746.1 hypothetical protein [Mycoplasma enhydrae]